VIFDSGHEQSRKIIFDVLSTYAVYRIVRAVVFWNFFMPDTPSHRLVNLSDQRAKLLFRDWARILTASSLIIFFCRMIEALEISNDVFRVTFIIGMLLIAIMLISLTLLHREDTKSLVLGANAKTSPSRLRTWVARIATPIMLIYIVSAWVASSLRLVLGSPGGFLLLAAPIIVFVVAIFVYGLAIFFLETFYQNRELKFYKSRRDRALREMREWQNNSSASTMALRLEDDRDDDLRDGEEMTIHADDRPKNVHRKYLPVFKPFFAGFIQATVITVSLGELSRLWGVDIGRDGGHPFAAFLDTVLVLVIAMGAYRAFNQYIDYKIIEEGGTLDKDAGKPGESDGEGGAGQSRLATLLPIFRNVLVSVIVIICLVVVLSNLGVDVGPLFAGAGVVGIAIGFGAQTLIRDIFSGTFFLIDDAFRKGEYIEIEDVRGIVEKISMRSFQLRHHLGAVHTIPFGEIKRITNFSRDWVMMKLPLRLPYDTDVERVRKLVKKLGQELLNDETIGELFLQPLKSQGVYRMEDSAMIVRIKYMTRPGDQFITRKAIYAAIRELFEKEGIKFAHREVTVRLAEDQKNKRLTAAQKKALTGAVRNVVENDEPTNAKGAKVASKYDDM
jgi:small-conductance mechanosensitive channel